MNNREELFEQLVENIRGVQQGMVGRSQNYKSLPFGQKTALFAVCANPKTNVKQLANKLKITSGAVTQHVEALVQAGLVKRAENPNDRRNVVIVPTAKGRKYLKRMKDHMRENLKEIFSVATNDELEVYVRVLKKINNKLQS